MLEMVITGLSLDPVSKLPVVVLCTANNSHILPIWVGSSEALSISLALKGARTTRPLAHELWLNTVATLGFSLRQIQITEVKDKIFYTSLKIGNENTWHLLDCRPSDAIVLAIRSGAPIMVGREVLNAAGYDLEFLLKSTASIPVLAGDGSEEASLEHVAFDTENKPEETHDLDTTINKLLADMDPESKYKM